MLTDPLVFVTFLKEVVPRDEFLRKRMVTLYSGTLEKFGQCKLRKAETEISIGFRDNIWK
jgi:hypothetical protein